MSPPIESMMNGSILGYLHSQLSGCWGRIIVVTAGMLEVRPDWSPGPFLSENKASGISAPVDQNHPLPDTGSKGHASGYFPYYTINARNCDSGEGWRDWLVAGRGRGKHQAAGPQSAESSSLTVPCPKSALREMLKPLMQESHKSRHLNNPMRMGRNWSS